MCFVKRRLFSGPREEYSVIQHKCEGAPFGATQYERLGTRGPQGIESKGPNTDRQKDRKNERKKEKEKGDRKEEDFIFLLHYYRVLYSGHIIVNLTPYSRILNNICCHDVFRTHVYLASYFIDRSPCFTNIIRWCIFFFASHSPGKDMQQVDVPL